MAETSKGKASGKPAAPKAKAKPKSKVKPKAKPKSKARSKAKPKTEPRLPSLKEAVRWIGMRIDGIGNRSLGRVAGIHVDVEDGKPRWVIVRLGPLAGCTALPFEHVAEGAGRLWAAYERDWVRQAPRFRQDEALAAGEELELCAHWAIREERGRAAEVVPHEDDEITAFPSEG